MVFFSIVYIDDGIFACRSLLDAQSASKLVRSDLQLSGWKSNEKKSNWEPRQLGEWLGIIVDTIRMLFIIPEKKIVKLKSVLTGLIDEFPNLCVRDVARVSGLVISLSLALGPIARLFNRQIYFSFNCDILGMMYLLQLKEFYTWIKILVNACRSV